MKPLRKHLKPIALFLAVIFLVQSCSVYQSKTVTSDEAISSSKKIKVKSVTGASYKFKSLEIVEGQLYGLAKKNSKTAKSLSDQIDQFQGDIVKILLTKDQINEIYLKNNVVSTFATLVLSSVVIIAAFAFALSRANFGPAS